MHKNNGKGSLKVKSDLCYGSSRPEIWLPTMTCWVRNLWSDHPVWLLSLAELVRPAVWPPWASQAYYKPPFSVHSLISKKKKNTAKEIFLTHWIMGNCPSSANVPVSNSDSFKVSLCRLHKYNSQNEYI